jgi:hypothetical protein
MLSGSSLPTEQLAAAATAAVAAAATAIVSDWPFQARRQCLVVH